MDKLQRAFFLGTTIAMLGLASNALAQWDEPGCGHSMGPDPARMEQMRERHQTLLHDSLQLTPEQEKAWTTFATKAKEAHAMNRPDPHEMESLSAPQRMDKVLERVREHEEHLVKLASALKEFYAVLTPKQQKIFDEFMPVPGSHEHGMQRP